MRIFDKPLSRLSSELLGRTKRAPQIFIFIHVRGALKNKIFYTQLKFNQHRIRFWKDEKKNENFTVGILNSKHNIFEVDQF